MVDKMNKLTQKLNSLKCEKMIDIERLFVEDNDLFNILSVRYPAKAGIYWIEVGKWKSKATELKPIDIDDEAEENKPLEEVLEEEPTNNQVEEEKPVETPKPINNDLVDDDEIEPNYEDAEVVSELEVVSEFPEDFKPLFNIGEKIKISYEYGSVIEDIKITNIKLETLNGERKYYYTYEVLDTGEVKTMGEKFLVEHEVLD